jgi:hypothetical protein
MNTDPADLRAENSRLRAEVEQLRQALYPPPPPPKRERDRPEKPTAYLLARQPQRDAEYSGQLQTLTAMKEQIARYEWSLAHRLEAVPHDALIALESHVVLGRLGSEDFKQIRWFRRASDEEMRADPERSIIFTPTTDQRQVLKAPGDPFFARMKELLRDIDKIDLSKGRRENVRAQGYLRVMDLVLATWNLALAKWRAGDVPGFRATLEDYDLGADRRMVEAKAAATSPTGPAP